MWAWIALPVSSIQPLPCARSEHPGEPVGPVVADAPRGHPAHRVDRDQRVVAFEPSGGGVDQRAEHEPEVAPTDHGEVEPGAVVGLLEGDDRTHRRDIDLHVHGDGLLAGLQTVHRVRELRADATVDRPASGRSRTSARSDAKNSSADAMSSGSATRRSGEFSLLRALPSSPR